MKKCAFLLMAIVALALTTAAHATEVNSSHPRSGSRSLLSEFVSHAEVRWASGPGAVASAADGCYEWDASNTCVGGDLTDSDPMAGGGGTKCPDVKDYSTCMSNCDCVLQNNYSKCKANQWCRRLAEGEHRACSANCIADW